MVDDPNPDGSRDPGDTPAAPSPDAAKSPAVQRFESCRWRVAADEGTPAHCSHRDVLPLAGSNGFDPDAWCADCGFFKVRRTPRKRPPAESYDRYPY